MMNQPVFYTFLDKETINLKNWQDKKKKNVLTRKESKQCLGIH